MDIDKKSEERYLDLQDKFSLLKSQVEEFDAIFENLDMGVMKCILDGGASVSYINMRGLDILGYTCAQFNQEVSQNFFSVILSQDVKLIKRNFKFLSSVEEPVYFRVRAKRRDGEIISLRFTGVALQSNGKRVGVFSFKDFEYQQVMEEEISRLETLMSNIMGGVRLCEYSEGLPIIYVSDGFKLITGYSRAQLREMSIDKYSKLLLYEDRHITKEILKSLSEKQSYSFEYRIKKRDGSITWVLDKGTLVFLDESNPVVQSILTDISLQKKTEEDLRISEKRYEIAMRFAEVSIFDYDIRTKRITTDEVDLNMFGMPGVLENGVEDIIQMGILSEESVTSMRNLYRKIDEGRASARATVSAKDLNGDNRLLEIQLVTIYSQSGEAVRAVGMRKDITEKVLLQKEKQYAEALASNRLMTFEANITTDTVIDYDLNWAMEMNLSELTSFSRLIDNACRNVILPEHVELLKHNFSCETIEKKYESGESLVVFEYQKRVSNGEYQWFEHTINIIREKITKDLVIRGYIKNINEKKKKEIRAQEELCYYESMVSKSLVVYEVNITQNLSISGHENWDKLFGISTSGDYTEMIQELYDKGIHCEDRDAFIQLYNRDNVISEYNRGKRSLVCDYRRLDEFGKYIWICCTMHLFEDPQNGDIRGFSYIEKIDEEKKKQLELIYKAQHDQLTGLYNKATVQEKINEFLNTRKAKNARHAFIIIDLDNFKLINDNFGHAYGDVVLSQTAARIRSLFRDADIIGRIGGDEFVALMKNIDGNRAALVKARDICSRVSEMFMKSGHEYHLSASIGIAFYSQHGSTYEELYSRSDTALYHSKHLGKDRFSIYSAGMQMPTVDSKEEQQDFLQELRGANLTEYIFRVLYEAEDKESAVNSVLSILGRCYNVSRAYVFENSPESHYISNTFEWCNEGVTPTKERMQRIMSEEDLKSYSTLFNKEGVCFVPDVRVLDGPWRAVKSDVVGMIQFSIVKNGEFIGFIGFDQCNEYKMPTKNEMSDYKKAVNILSLFILEMRTLNSALTTSYAAMSVVNGMDSYAYVCCADSHEVLFVNDKMRALFPDIKVGGLCYSGIWNDGEMSNGCPMELLRKTGEDKHTFELYNHCFRIWFKVTAMWVDWIEGKKACLINAVDISQYKT